MTIPLGVPTKAGGADLVKFIRDNFRAPPSKPYRCKKIWTKTKDTMIMERSENLWEEHYVRRTDNMRRGYHSVPWEPYKMVGTELPLNTKDLVLSTMKGCLKPEVYSDGPKTEDVLKFEKKTATPVLPPIGQVSDKVTVSRTVSQVSTTPVPVTEESGYSNVKRHLSEYNQLIKNIHAGQFYEDYLKQRQEEQRNQTDSTEADNDMVLMSLTNLQLGLHNVQFVEDSGSESDTEIVHEEKISPFKDKKEKIFSVPIGDIPSPEDIAQIKPPRGRRISIMINNRKMTLKEDHSWSMESGLNASTIEGLNKLINVKSGITEKKNRIRRDHLEFLESLLIILNTLHNIKSKELKSRVPLKIEVMKTLRKEYIPRQAKQVESHVKWHSKTKRPQSVTKVGSILGDCLQAGPGGGMANMVSMASQLKRRSIWPGRQKVGYDHPPIETWEDLVSTEPKKNPNFQIQSKIVLKALMWSRRKALIGLGQDSKVSLNAPTPDSLLHIPGSQYRIRRELMTTESHRQQVHTSTVRRMPVWQKVALDKPVKIDENRGKKDVVDPENAVEESRKALEKIKHDLQLETDMEFHRIDREKMIVFKWMYKAFDGMSPLFEEHISKMRQARSSLNSVEVSSEVQPSKWYDELQGKTHSLIGLHDDQVDEVLGKLGKYSTMDNKSIQFVKAKLCLIVMSLPAYEVLQIPMQKAIKYVMETIILGEVKQLEDWFKHRKIPYFVVEESAIK